MASAIPKTPPRRIDNLVAFRLTPAQKRWLTRTAERANLTEGKVALRALETVLYETAQEILDADRAAELEALRAPPARAPRRAYVQNTLDKIAARAEPAGAPSPADAEPASDVSPDGGDTTPDDDGAMPDDEAAPDADDGGEPKETN
jgi:hypothetical protein